MMATKKKKTKKPNVSTVTKATLDAIELVGAARQLVHVYNDPYGPDLDDSIVRLEKAVKPFEK